MDKELIDRAWRVLPKEFKEEVKETFRKCLGVPKYEAITIKPMLLECLFGYHNLTSDAVEEVMLTVPRKKVEEKWQRAYEQEAQYSRAQDSPVARLELYYNRGILSILDTLFGSKCLPDAHEDNFTTKEPQPAEPKNDGTSQKQYVPQNAESGTHSFNHILKDDFRDYNRLHIAAMIAQGIMANSNPQMVDTNVERLVDLAILTADTLIKKVEGASK